MRERERKRERGLLVVSCDLKASQCRSIVLCTIVITILVFINDIEKCTESAKTIARIRAAPSFTYICVKNIKNKDKSKKNPFRKL